MALLSTSTTAKLEERVGVIAMQDAYSDALDMHVSLTPNVASDIEAASHASVCSDASSEDVEAIAYATFSSAAVTEHVSGVGKRGVGVVVQVPLLVAKAKPKPRGGKTLVWRRSRYRARMDLSPRSYGRWCSANPKPYVRGLSAEHVPR
jgi:hypothetical protein